MYLKYDQLINSNYFRKRIPLLKNIQRYFIVLLVYYKIYTSF